MVAAHHWDLLNGGFPLAAVEGSAALWQEAGLQQVRSRLQAGDGPLTLSARANAVSGIKA